MNVQKLMQDTKPVLIDFSADWCSSCQTMDPILEEIKGIVGDDVSFLKINIDKTPQVVSGFHIRSIPTFIFFRGGKMIWRKSGLITKREFLSLIQQHIMR